MMLAPLVAAFVFALLVARRAPQHRPIAGLLLLGLVLDGCRLVAAHGLLGLTERQCLALCLLVPPAGAWAGLRAWRARAWGLDLGASAWAAIGAAWALWCPRARAWWDTALPMAQGLSVALQIGAWLAFRRARGPSTITQRCAGVLLAGDAAGLVGLGAREWVAWQGALVSCVLVVVQAYWLCTVALRAPATGRLTGEGSPTRGAEPQGNRAP